MRRAKIVCTIGPATESKEQLRALVDAGMDVARINRSHGSAEEHEAVYHGVREAAVASGRSVAVLVDLQGPKIRLGRFGGDEKHWLNEGDVFTITTEDVVGTKELVSTTHKGLPGDARVGDPILIDDGKVLVRVTAVEGPRVVTRVEVAGPVSNNKGLNLPGVAVSVPALSEKDRDDLRWALRLGADIIALSFVRSAADFDDVKTIMDEEGRSVPVIAKIEKPQAVENLAEIIDAFDGVMVARGDLAVELPLEQVPLVQKRIVELARRNAKPVIVATQVLESMTNSPRPTRAEASDCANAVLDGADAVMLSGETSVGDFPILTVETMARIIVATEEAGRERMAPLGSTPHTRGGAITRAAAEIGEIAGREVPRDLHAVWRLGATHVASALVDPVARVHAARARAQRPVALAGAPSRTRCPRWRTPTRWSARSTRPCRPTASPRSATSSSSSRAPRWASPVRRTRSSCTGSVTARTSDPR